MSYSNDTTQIRAGLTSYIGALIESSYYGPQAAKQSVVAILLEEALKIAQPKEDEPFDLYVLKPMLRAMMIVYQQRIAELEKLPPTQEINGKVKEYSERVRELSEWLKKI